ncbi:UDP-4-amino-4-deoxy-L-arabinose--oxoglutarate aminotransferase [Luteitalea pratensis]|uniref:UDP-4-amino-4-deoxy-L-arabinose--oxoglutarate aminotransferase n=1 Tax=Luteitalea pratensis TaxID=1855912 RepID=A0A143PP00_LUTPR|nr:DegT/DnrJ/EryC1/StrS aminotransferase family protein [Luteitalea pratensis]AMY10397.1 UDP-4-amino-4-deoxy-L-arabinose--oxoglutarate aminotransferase [Luteitalea pratensis]
MSIGPRGHTGPAFVPLARPDMGDAELSAIAEVLASGWLTTGPRVKAFEAAFAQHVGAAEAVALNSCTAGLHLALLASHVGPGDEVITTPLTFCATANTILHAGGTPVFVDVDRATGTMDPDATAAAITPRTRAILPVHHAGRPADPLTFRALADAAGLKLIEDAAHCVDGAVDGRRIGSIADVTAFSFYSTKNLATGEGGMVTTDSPEDADWMRVAALHGLSRDAWARNAPGAPAQYEVVMAGYKYNMMDLQAALGLAQLDRLADMQAQRGRLWDRYEAGLAHLPLGRPAPVPDTWTHARHLYTVMVDPDRCGWTRDALQSALGREGIGTSVHFRALHLHSYYAERFSLRRGMYPHAEHHSDHSLSLPFWSGMPLADADRVVETLQQLLSRTM